MINKQSKNNILIRKKVEKETANDFSSSNLPKKNKKLFKFKIVKTALISIFSIFILFSVIYGLAISNKTRAESITQDVVLNDLSKQIILPNETPVKIIRIQEVKNLIKQDSFYKDAENGDYIIVFEKMAIIYNFDKKLIKNVKTY